MRQWNQPILKIFIFFFLVNTMLVGAVTDSDLSNNNLNKTVKVIETRNLSLLFTSMSDVADFERTVDRNINFLNSTYPISDNGVDGVKDFSTFEVPDVLTVSDLPTVQNRLYTKAYLSQNIFNNVIGIVKEGYLNSLVEEGKTVAGINIAPVVGVASAILIDEAHLSVTAHEVSHTLELCDEYDSDLWIDQGKRLLFIPGVCPNGDLDGDSQLDSNCLNNSDYSLESGCPTQTYSKLYEDFGIINNTTPLRNFMGTSDKPNFSTSIPTKFESWIDNLSYTALFERLNVSSDYNMPQLRFYKIPLTEKVIVFRFQIGRNGSTELLNSYTLEGGFVQNTSNLTGNFSVNVLNSSQGTISNVSFQPQFTVTTSDGGDIDINETIVIFALPLNNQTIDKIEIRSLTSTIVEVNRSTNTPIPNLTFPLGGEIFDKSFTITWNATDLDNDTLNYAILISSDNGSTFSTLEIDYPNTSLIINSTNFAESSQYKIKILATDGINTGNDTTNTFTIFHDQNKFLIKDNAGNNIAWFGDAGNIVIKGTLEQNSSFQRTENYAFSIENNNEFVLIIENNGSMYIDGTLAENQDAIPVNMERNEFRFKWNGEFKTNINESGYIFTKGTLTENGNP